MTALTIVGSILLGVCGLLAALFFFFRGLRRQIQIRGREKLDARYAEGEVLRSDLDARFFGLTSKGGLQLRGNGPLALTADELWFQLLVGDTEVAVPLKAIDETKLVRRHLGKGVGQDLLYVGFESDGVPDSMAFWLPDPKGFKEALDRARAPFRG